MKILKSILRNIWLELKEPTSSLFLTMLSLLISVPIFVSLYKFLPVVEVFDGNGFRLDYVIFSSLIFIFSYWMVKKFSKLFYILSILGFLGLSFSSMIEFYTFRNLYYDYSSLIYNLNEKIIKIDFNEKEDPFSRKAKIKSAVNYKNELVREYAHNWAIKNFKAYTSFVPEIKILHSFSIFKEVRSRWNYIYDPSKEEFFAKSSLTLNPLLKNGNANLTGDCDDYSILIAGLLKNIGCEVQLVRTSIINEDSTEVGHIYPELKIGTLKDLEIYSYLIKTKLFKDETKDKFIYYYKDKDDNIWLNFDYNDHYPGGPYQSMTRLSILNWSDEN